MKHFGDLKTGVASAGMSIAWSSPSLMLAIANCSNSISRWLHDRSTLRNEVQSGLVCLRLHRRPQTIWAISNSVSRFQNVTIGILGTQYASLTFQCTFKNYLMEETAYRNRTDGYQSYHRTYCRHINVLFICQFYADLAERKLTSSLSLLFIIFLCITASGEYTVQQTFSSVTEK